MSKVEDLSNELYGSQKEEPDKWVPVKHETPEDKLVAMALARKKLIAKPDQQEPDQSKPQDPLTDASIGTLVTAKGITSVQDPDRLINGIQPPKKKRSIPRKKQSPEKLKRGKDPAKIIGTIITPDGIASVQNPDRPIPGINIPPWRGRRK